MNSTPEPFFLVWSVLGLVAIAVIAVIGIMLVVVAVKSRSVGAVVGVILGIILIPILLVALLVPVRSVTSQANSQFPSPPAPPAVSAPVESTMTWSPAFQSTYGWASDANGAGIYSSADNAGAALVRLLMQEFGTRFAEYPASVHVQVSMPLNEWVPTLGPHVAKQFREALPSSNVDSGPMNVAPQTTDDTLLVTLDAVDLTRSSNAPWDSSKRHVQGGLSIKAEYLDYVFEVTKPFVEKPWVERFDEYLSQQPGRRLFRAVSSDFGLSQHESEQSARNVAALILATQVDPRNDTLDRATMAKVIMDQLDSKRLVIDRFTQERQTKSGNKVWQTALLIDAEPSKLDGMVKEYRYATLVQQGRRQSGIGGIIMLAVLIVILYLVLNELTKGYFVWNLRVTAMLLMLCLAVAFCWWVKIT